MELKIFFDKVDEQVYENNLDQSSFFHHISIHNDNFPDWQNSKIVLFGLTEHRENIGNEGIENGPNEIRNSLYSLKRNAKYVKIADLGNLRIGHTVEETRLRIKEICEILIEKDIFVILIGGTQDLALGQYWAYEKTEKMISVVTVDAVVNLFSENDEPDSFNHLHHIISHEPNYLFHLSHLASQSFLNDVSVQETMEKLHFENIRIGQMRENFTETEPIIRQADMLSFDISSIKKADAPGNKNANVYGLTAEEACQIAWYAGLNDKLSTAGIYEFNPTFDKDNQTAFVIATMVWYLIDGFNHRKNDLDFESNQFMRYMVSIGKNPEQIIVFYKSKLSEKWWMEVPYPANSNSKMENKSIIPCSYSDYETALNSELPDRWVLMHNKLF
jgi:formiminoglutamase